MLPASRFVRACSVAERFFFICIHFRQRFVCVFRYSFARVVGRPFFVERISFEFLWSLCRLVCGQMYYHPSSQAFLPRVY